MKTYIYLHLSAIRVFDGRIIALDPFIVDKLGCFAVRKAFKMVAGVA